MVQLRQPLLYFTTGPSLKQDGVSRHCITWAFVFILVSVSPVNHPVQSKDSYTLLSMASLVTVCSPRYLSTVLSLFQHRMPSCLASESYVGECWIRTSLFATYIICVHCIVQYTNSPLTNRHFQNGTLSVVVPEGIEPTTSRL